MSEELPLAGTGFVMADHPGPGLPRQVFRLEVSRPSEETLLLELAPSGPEGRLLGVASVDLPTAAVEAVAGVGGIVPAVRNGRGESKLVRRGDPAVDLEPGDVLFVADAPLALRYEPWEAGESGGFQAWFRADFAEAARVREDFTAFHSDEGVPGPIVHDLALALQEALDNVVEHAYRGRPRGVVLVEASFELASRLRVTVRDRGPAFDPSAAAPIVRSLEAATPGGLGLHLVRALVDTVAHERRSGENRLVLVRRITPA